jgi:hypothetical protein
MEFFKPSYMLRLPWERAPLKGLSEDVAFSLFKTYSTELWEFTKTIADASDRKQMQADWCAINRKKKQAGYSRIPIGAIYTELVTNKLPTSAVSCYCLHFAHTGSNVFCIWQFINDGKLREADAEKQAVQRVVEAEAEKQAVQRVAEAKVKAHARVVAEAEADAEAEVAVADEKQQLAPASTNTSAEASFCCTEIAELKAQIQQQNEKLVYMHDRLLAMGAAIAHLHIKMNTMQQPAPEPVPAAPAPAPAPAPVKEGRVTHDTIAIGDIFTFSTMGSSYYGQVKSFGEKNLTYVLLDKVSDTTYKLSSNSFPSTTGSDLNFARALYYVPNASIISP